MEADPLTFESPEEVFVTYGMLHLFTYLQSPTFYWLMLISPTWKGMYPEWSLSVSVIESWLPVRYVWVTMATWPIELATSQIKETDSRPVMMCCVVNRLISGWRRTSCAWINQTPYLAYWYEMAAIGCSHPCWPSMSPVVSTIRCGWYKTSVSGQHRC